MITSGKYPGDSLVDIQERWSLTDLLDAHEILDMFERVDRRQAEKLKADAER